MLGLDIDLAGDEARSLLPGAIPIDGPVPVGDEPADLLRTAAQLPDRRYLELSRRAGAGGHTAKGQRLPYLRRKEGHEFRNNLVRQGTLHSA